MRKIKLKGNSEGISAIEVIIALAILGVAVVAFLEGLSTAFTAASISDERSVAQGLAQSQMEYVKNRDYSPEPSDHTWSYTVTSSDRSSSDKPDWWDADNPPLLSDDYAGYCARVEAVDIDADGDGNIDDDIRRITVTVYHSEEVDENQKVLTLEGYKADR